jgi:hypothetical protein
MTAGDALADLASAIDLVLTGAGYQRVPPTSADVAPTSIAAFEDPYAIVAVRTFATLPELTQMWLETQDQVVDLVTRSVTSIDAKAWDGYLVLATADRVPIGRASDLQAITSNTRRIRKLVVTGDDLVGAASEAAYIVAVRRSLASLLPLQIEVVHDVIDPLEELPSRLQAVGVSTQDVRTMLDAYRDGRPMVGALHESWGRIRGGDGA